MKDLKKLVENDDNVLLAWKFWNGSSQHINFLIGEAQIPGYQAPILYDPGKFLAVYQSVEMS